MTNKLLVIFLSLCITSSIYALSINYLNRATSSTSTARLSFAPMDTAFVAEDVAISSSPLSTLSSTGGSFHGTAYAYPSPAPKGETDIGFRVTGGGMSIKVQLYDSIGSRLYETTVEASIGYNRVPISPVQLGYQLPVGVYYFLVFDEDNTLLSKGKFGVTP